MKTIWILVADSSRAKIFEAHGAMRGVHEIETFSNPEGRAHNRDLKTDGSGRYFAKGEHNQGHTAAPQVEPAEHEAELFAKRMDDYLEKARVDHRFDRLHLIAPPKFLGLIRGHLGKEVEGLIDAALSKDVAWFDAKAIEDYIRDTDPAM